MRSQHLKINQSPTVPSWKWNNGGSSQALRFNSIGVIPCTCLGASSHRRSIITPSSSISRSSHWFQKPLHYAIRRLSDGRGSSLFHRLALAGASPSMAAHASQPLRHLHCKIMAAHHLFDLWRLPLLCYGILLLCSDHLIVVQTFTSSLLFHWFSNSTLKMEVSFTWFHILPFFFPGCYSSWIDRVTEGIWHTVENVSPFLGFGSFRHATWAAATLLQQGYGHRPRCWTINCHQKEGLKKRNDISCYQFL